MIIYNQVLSNGIDLKIIALINKAEYRGKIFIQCLSCTLHILVDLYSNLYNNSHFTPCTTVIVWFWQTISVQDDANHCHYLEKEKQAN